jgi:acyl carrier protein
MNDTTVREKLTSCFRVVFPKLSITQIPDASVSNVSAWDSVAALTLMHVIQEEFSLEIDPEKLHELDSFAALTSYLLAESQLQD